MRSLAAVPPKAAPGKKLPAFDSSAMPLSFRISADLSRTIRGSSELVPFDFQVIAHGQSAPPA